MSDFDKEEEYFKQLTIQLRLYTLSAAVYGISDEEYKDGVREIFKKWFSGGKE